jgi:ribonuclease P protein component
MLKHILKNKDFNVIVKTGEKYKGKILCLYAKDNSENTDLAIGLIISKKKAIRAVTRNYLKRIIYSFFSHEREKIKTGKKIVIRVISTVEKNERRKVARRIRAELDSLLRRAKLTDG